MLRCIIVDDDLMARKNLERLCLKHEALQLNGVFESAVEALDFLEQQQQNIDLVFLDVEMPEMSGIELLDRSSSSPMVVFTTGNAEYAIDAFEYRAIDFLKKPITQPRFEQAISKALETSRKEKELAERARARANEVYVRNDGRFHRISFDDILFFENIGDYVKVKTVHGQHIIYAALKNIEDKLDDPRFLKIHRSYIINLDKIRIIEESHLYIDKTLIPISRAHKSNLMNRLRIL